MKRLGADTAFDVGGDSPVWSEQRTPVGLSNHPAHPNMATTRLAAVRLGLPSAASTTKARETSCPSDRLRPVADGTVPRWHPQGGGQHGGSTDRGTEEGWKPRPTARLLRASHTRCEGRLPSGWVFKCGCARRAYEDETSADAGSIPASSTCTGRDRLTVLGPVRARRPGRCNQSHRRMVRGEIPRQPPSGPRNTSMRNHAPRLAGHRQTREEHGCERDDWGNRDARHPERRGC